VTETILDGMFLKCIGCSVHTHGQPCAQPIYCTDHSITPCQVHMPLQRSLRQSCVACSCGSVVDCLHHMQ